MTERLELVAVPPLVPAGPAGIELRLRGVVIGDLDLRVCPDCRVAVLEYVRIDPPYRRRGLATAALRAALAQYRDYRWGTSALEDTAEARGFWDALDWWPGAVGDAPSCVHMREADQRAP